MKRWLLGVATLLPWILAPTSLLALGDETTMGSRADKAAIEQAIDASISWFKTKDFDLLFRVLADDAEFFIFHPDSKSTIRGAAAFREFSQFFRDPELVYSRHEIRALQTHVSRTGEVAWFSALLDDCSLYRGEESCWRDCRWTGVLEKRGGRWVIVQMHFSFASDRMAAETGPAEEKAAAAREFAGYEEMRGAVIDLYGRQEYAEAASILTAALDRYPDHVMANAFNLALMYAGMDSLDQAVRALEEGHRRGIFYGKWSLQQGPWEVFSGLESFQRVLARNEELIAEAQKKAVMKLEVVTPPGYEEGRKYPLFVALHGGGENLEQFKPKWTSPRLRKEFIVAYVQSTQVAAMDGYHWQDDAITRRELGEAYREVAGQYAIDTLRVLFGGFSSGGYGTLLTVFDGTLPASGFVVLCPEVPPDPSENAMEAAMRRGVRGTLLTTEQDGRLERQRKYVVRLAAHGLDVRCVVTPNIGHWYPDDLERLIDEALAHIWPEP